MIQKILFIDKLDNFLTKTTDCDKGLMLYGLLLILLTPAIFIIL